MSKPLEEKSVAELREIFLKSHWAWMAVWNPEGYASGEVHKAWNIRIDNILRLVRAIEKEKG